MSILGKIVAHKMREVAQNEEIKPIKLLEKSIYFNSPVVSLKDYLLRKDKVGVIAEIKRSSPSAGTIKEYLDIEQLSIAYMKAGATALSVLTDQQYFGGSNRDLTEARKFNYCPILRKDFIIDEYQVFEAKSIGADCVLLIARCLSPARCRELAAIAKKLGMEVLLEVHKEEEVLSHLHSNIDLVGVNNRNLVDFRTDIETSIHLANCIPNDFVMISESGISSAEQLNQLRGVGYKGFLIGSFFMKQARPAKACRDLIHQLNAMDV